MRAVRLALVAWGAFVSPVWAGSCDYVIRWDERAIADCFKEINDQKWIRDMEIKNLETENRLLQSQICLLVMDMKTESAAFITAESCTKARGPKKKPAPKQ